MLPIDLILAISSIYDVLQLAHKLKSLIVLKRLAVAAIVIAVLTVPVVVIVKYVSKPSPDKVENTLDGKIKDLTKSLLQAADSIDLIEKEIKQRQELVLKLKQDAEQSQKLKELNSAQVAAIAQTLRLEIKHESSESFWPSTITNVLFALLGAIFGELIRLFRSFYNKRKNDVIDNNKA